MIRAGTSSLLAVACLVQERNVGTPTFPNWRHSIEVAA